MENLSDVVLVIVGVVLSLIFRYAPKLADWYAKQESGPKGLIMLGAVAVVSLAYFGLSCTSFAEALKITIPCTNEGAVALTLVFFKILIGNQAAFLLTPAKKA
jgi:hypothetical protein